MVAASVTLQPAGSPHPTSVGIALQEQMPASRSRPQVTFSNETIFLTKNR
jgi:hypothetical protein